MGYVAILSESIITFFELLFRVSFIIVILYLLSRTHFFVDAVLGKRDRSALIFLVLVGSALEIIASEFGIPFPEGIMADIRMSIAFVFVLIGGPLVGIPVALIGGAYRMTGLFWRGFSGALGYEFAVAGALNTIGAGIVGSFLYTKGIKISTLDRRKEVYVMLALFGWIVIYREIVCPLTVPFFSDMDFVESFYFSTSRLLITSISDLFSMAVFLSFLKSISMEEKKKRVLQKLVQKYGALIGPVAERIAKDTAKEEDYPFEYLKEKEK